MSFLKPWNFEKILSDSYSLKNFWFFGSFGFPEFQYLSGMFSFRFGTYSFRSGMNSYLSGIHSFRCNFSHSDNHINMCFMAQKSSLSQFEHCKSTTSEWAACIIWRLNQEITRGRLGRVYHNWVSAVAEIKLQGLTLALAVVGLAVYCCVASALTPFSTTTWTAKC